MAQHRSPISFRSTDVCGGVRGGFAAVILTSFVGTSAFAQVHSSSLPPASGFVRPGDPLRPTFKRIEQGISDTGPLRVGLRDVGIDLIVPTGFRDVFEIQPGGAATPGGPAASKQYARINGAVTAVFPRSIYTPTDDGIIAEIPPGTIFYVGGIPKNLYTPSLGHIGGADGSARASPLLADSRVDTSVRPMAGAVLRQAPLTPAGLMPEARQTAHAAASADTSTHRSSRTVTSPVIPAKATPVRSMMTDDELRQRAVQSLMRLAVTGSTSETTGAAAGEDRGRSTSPIDAPALVAPPVTSEPEKKKPDTKSDAPSVR